MTINIQTLKNFVDHHNLTYYNKHTIQSNDVVIDTFTNEFIDTIGNQSGEIMIGIIRSHSYDTLINNKPLLLKLLIKIQYVKVDNYKNFFTREKHDAIIFKKIINKILNSIDLHDVFYDISKYN